MQSEDIRITRANYTLKNYMAEGFTSTYSTTWRIPPFVVRPGADGTLQPAVDRHTRKMVLPNRVEGWTRSAVPALYEVRIVASPSGIPRNWPQRHRRLTQWVSCAQ